MASMLDLPHPDSDAADTAAGAPSGRARLRAVPELDAPPLDFDDVVRRLTPRLQRYAKRRLGDRHEAEELVQEALLRAYDHRDSLRTEDDVAAWSTCVTGRLVIDRLRVRGRSTCMAEVPEGTRVGRDTADVVVARDEARLALDALDAMPARQAAVLWAREVEGLAYNEIGARFSMTEPAVRSVLSRARKSLRKEFATRGGTLPAGGLVALAPWLDGLGWLDRLRRLAGRAAAPAALGMAGLGVIGGAALGPWGAEPETLVKPERAIVAVSSSPTAPAQARATLAPAATTPTPVQVASAPAPAPEQAPARAPQAVLAGTGVTGACVLESDTASVVGSDCDPQRDPVLHVGPELPDNPTGVKRVGVEADRLDCAAVPDLPLTECTSDGDQR